MTMMINSDINIAVVQFGRKKDEEELKILARRLTKERLADWYYFDETANKEFEIKDLKNYYDFIYECIDIENFYEV